MTLHIGYTIIFCSWCFALGYLLCTILTKARQMKQAEVKPERETGIIDDCPTYIRQVINSGIPPKSKAFYEGWLTKIETQNTNKKTA